MLTREENGWNLKGLKICSALNLLPVKIDMTTGKMQRQSSKKRIYLLKFLFSLAIAHCFYIIGRLIQSTLIEPEKYFRWNHFIVHFPFAVAYCLMYFTGYRLFWKQPDECVMIYNQLFAHRENPVQKMMEEEKEQQEELKRKSGWESAKRAPNLVAESAPDQKQEKQVEKSESKVRPLLTWPPQYSLDELLARIFLPAMVETEMFTALIYAVDLNRPQHLYSSLPPEFQNVYCFFGFLGIEVIFLTLFFVIMFYSLLCQLLFFGKCQLEFKQLDFQLRNLEEKFQSRPLANRDIGREIWILREISKELREFVLFIELFNRCFPPSIFAFKIDCMANSILMYFFAIRHFQDFPFLALFCGYVSIVNTFLYGTLYEKAFSIPEKMEQLKRQFSLSTLKTTSTRENAKQLLSFRAEMKREIGGIRDVGVKVGNFHTLERQSTPKFMDFVFQNVVTLLVTFPR